MATLRVGHPPKKKGPTPFVHDFLCFSKRQCFCWSLRCRLSGVYSARCEMWAVLLQRGVLGSGQAVWDVRCETAERYSRFRSGDVRCEMWDCRVVFSGRSGDVRCEMWDCREVFSLPWPEARPSQTWEDSQIISHLTSHIQEVRRLTHNLTSHISHPESEKTHRESYISHLTSKTQRLTSD